MTDREVSTPTRLYELSQKIDLMGFEGITQSEYDEFWKLSNVIKKRFIDYPDYEELASFYKSFRTTMEQCFKNYPNITPKILEEYRESTGIKAGEIMEAQIKDIEEDIKDAEVFTAFLKMGLETHEMTVEMLKIERDSRQLFLNRMIEG